MAWYKLLTCGDEALVPSARIEVTPALLDELIATFSGNVAVARLDAPVGPPCPMLGWVLRVERRDRALWGEVRWLADAPLGVAAFGLAVAFIHRRRDPRTGEHLGARILSAFPASAPRPGYDEPFERAEGERT